MSIHVAEIAAAREKWQRKTTEREAQESPDILVVNVPIRYMDCVEIYKRIQAVLPETMVFMKTPFVIEELVRSILKNSPFQVHTVLESASTSISRRVDGAQRCGGLHLLISGKPDTWDSFIPMLETTQLNCAITNTYEDVISILQNVSHRMFTV